MAVRVHEPGHHGLAGDVDAGGARGNRHRGRRAHLRDAPIAHHHGAALDHLAGAVDDAAADKRRGLGLRHNRREQQGHESPSLKVTAHARELTRAKAPGRVALQVVLDADLPGGVLGGHVADRPEDRTLRDPRAVVAAQHPEDAAVGVRVAAVERVLVVQLDHHRQGLARRRRSTARIFLPHSMRR